MILKEISGNIRHFNRIALLALISLLLAACGNNAKQANEEAMRHVERANAYVQQGQYRAALIEARNAVRKAPDNPKSQVAMGSLLLALGDNQGVAELLKDKETLSENARILLAEAYLNLGKFRSCRETLAGIPEASRTTEWQLLEARAIGGTGDLGTARALLTALEAREPQLGEVNLRLAQIETLENRLEQAERQLEQALRKNTNDVDALYTLGILQYRKNDLERAAQTLTDALGYTTAGDVLTLDRSRILRSLAQILSEQGRTTEALVYQRLIADSNPVAVEAQRKFMDALELYKQGDTETAETMLTELYRANPDNATNALLLGVINFQNRDFDAAESLFAGHLDTELASPQIISAAAITSVQLKKIDEALALLREALKDHKNNADLWALYGLTLLNSDSTNKDAVDALEKALQLDPGPQRNNLRTALAQYHFAQGKPELARQRLEKALELDGDNIAVQNNYLSALLREKQYDDASRFIRGLDKSGTDAFNLALMRARLAESQGDNKQLIRQLKLAVSADKKRAEPLLTLGRLYLREKNYAEARRQFELALQRDNELQVAYQGIVTTWEADEKADQAKIELVKLTEKYPNNTSFAVLADYQSRRTDFAEAEKTLQRLKPTEDGSYPSQTILQVIARHATNAVNGKDYDEAVRVVKKGLERQPDHPVLLRLLASTNIAAGRSDAASETIGRLSALSGNESLVRELNGDLSYKNESTAEAIASYRAAWDATPSNQLARKLLKIYTEQNNTAAAEAFTREWAEVLPNDLAAQLQYAGQLQNAGNCEKAMAIYDRIVTRVVNNAAIAVINNMALCSIDTDTKRAADLASQAYKLAPNSAAVVDTYGWVLLKQGNRQKALELLQKAAEMAPENQEIQAHLAAALKEG